MAPATIFATGPISSGIALRGRPFLVERWRVGVAEVAFYCLEIVWWAALQGCGAARQESSGSILW